MTLKRLLVVITLSGGLCTVTPSIAQQDDATRHADAVEILINDGEYENAIARVEAALKDHGKNLRLQLQRGLILVRLGQLDNAAAHYRKLLKRYKRNPEPGNNLAMVYRYQKKYDKAIELFRSTIKRFPNYAEVRSNLGDTYIERAAEQYENALTLAPENELVESKFDTAKRFNEIATRNTAAERRRITTEKRAAEQAVAELNAIKQAQANAQADPRERVLGTLESWITAWTSRNPENYLAHYSQEFDPGKGLALDQWIDKQSNLLDQAGYIKLKLDDINLHQTDTNQMIATFSQTYESDILRARTQKSLWLRRYEDNRWLIIREESRPIE